MKNKLPLLLLLCPAVAFAGASASVFKKGKPTNQWAANAAIDGKTETAWMVPGESANRGEWIMIDVPKGTIDKIRILPGYAKSDETFTDYARVKKLKVDVLCCADSTSMETQSTTSLDVPDKKEMVEIDIDDLEVGNDMFGGKAKIWIVDIYEGEDYPSVAISEILVVMKEFNAAASFASDSGDDPTHMIMDTLDESTRTFWTSPSEGATFTFEADGFGLSSFEFQHGPAGYAKVKKIKVTANDVENIVDVDEKAGWHKVEIPGPYGYTGSAWGEIVVEILEVTPGTKPEVAISEFKANATNFEGI
jgi:hypothetical protein